MEVSKADEDDRISSRVGEALDKLLLDEEDKAAVSIEDEFIEDGGKRTATGFDLGPVGSDEEVLPAEFEGGGELPNPCDDDDNEAAAVSLTVVGSVEDGGGVGGGGFSASGEDEGSITTTVVELFDSGRSGSKSTPSTGVTVQVVGVAAAMLMVELNPGEVEASENDAKVSDGRLPLDSVEVVTMSGLGASKLLTAEGVETSSDVALDDDEGAILTGEDTTTDGVDDTIVGGATVGVANEDETVTVPDGGITKGMENNGRFMATTGREKRGAMLTDGGDVTEGVANLEVTLVVGAGKLFTIEDLMSGAGAFVILCVLPCRLAEF
jgi:hypothetical protein